MTLLDGLIGFLRTDGWPILEIGDSFVHTRFAGRTHAWPCAGRTFEPQGQVVFDSVLPLQVPDSRRAGLATLLLHVNWTMVTGAFAVDPDSGAVRFRTALLLPDAPEMAIKGLVYANVLTVDRCVETIAATVAGELALGQALAAMGYAESPA
jgi:hypothetical protein